MPPFATVLGHIQFYRGKGAPWIEVFRPWIVPMVFSGAGAKYLGLQTRWAVLLAVALPVLTEVLAVLLGRWEHRVGATEAHYRLASEVDPYKAESLALLREIRDRLRPG